MNWCVCDLNRDCVVVKEALIPLFLHIMHGAVSRALVLAFDRKTVDNLLIITFSAILQVTKIIST